MVPREIGYHKVACVRALCYLWTMAKEKRPAIHGPKISVTLETEIHELAKAEAEKSDVSLSWWVRGLVLHALASRKRAA